MALTDIMSVEMNGKYVDDSSSSSSVSSDSDSDDVSSLSSSSSSSSSSGSNSSSASKKKRTVGAGNGGAKGMQITLSDPDDDSDLDGTYGKKSPPPPPPSTTAAKRKKAAPTPKKKAPVARVPKPRTKPPAPSRAAATKKASYASSSSSGVSSDSSSSSDSSGSGDDFSEVEEAKRKLEALKQATKAAVEASVAAKASAVAAAAKKNRASSKKKSAHEEISPESLKVTLKLPPGFIANNSENGGVVPPTAGTKAKRPASSPAPKRQRTTAATPASRKKTPASAAAKTKTTTAASKTVKKARASSAANKKGASKIAAAPLPATMPVLPQGPAILSKLIPTGPTVPKEEIRGSRELSFIDKQLASSRPEEVHEADVPVEFNDPYAVEADALRNLDLFFFCDEQGNPISLEILDRPKEQRPRIMGFGTIVQHLPPAERPLPVKYVLPSPAFPSRSRKRPRNDNSSSSQPRPAEASSSASRSKKAVSKRSTKKVKVSKESESIFQGDGEFYDDGYRGQWINSDNIFQKNSAFKYSRHQVGKRFSQLDGQSDSESESSNMTSDDDEQQKSQSGGAQSDDDSELLSTASSSSSESGSDNEARSNSSSSVSGSDVETGLENDHSKPSPNAESNSNSTHARRIPNDSEDNAEQKPKRTSKSKPKATSSNPVVNELMRTDEHIIIEAQGTDDELNLMECGFRHPPEYKRARVWLPEITDWCLDYSEGDPTLWVITPHAWYKIAGPLSGLLPHSYYRETFKHVRMLFESSYLVAYVLKEWLPINKKVSYRATLEQIVELSLKGRYRVTGWFLMENYHFILSQICNLFPDKDTYVESMFFRQLQRLNEAHQAREARRRSELANRELRRAEREKERAEREKERNERKERIEDERKKWKNQREEEKKMKEQERKYPIEDLELLYGADATENKLPVKSADLEGVTGDLLGELIMAWQTICTFKDFVTLEPISLEALVHRMTMKCKEGTDIGLAQIFLAFLRAILAEKSFTSLMDDIVVEGNIKVSDLFLNSERTYGICERPYNDMLNIITWQDILRQLMSKDLGIDASIGHVEPLVGCEVVRQTLYMQTVSAPFNAPVDTSLKGLEDYAQVVKQPMDLGTIKQKLDSGEYEGSGGYERFAADVRLVWENAILYNGEESEIGRAAIALSDIFEQDYRRFVVGRIQANDGRIEGCKKAKSELLARVDKQAQSSTSYIDIVHALYSFEFHEVRSSSLLLNDLTYLESQVEKEISTIRDHRKRAADLESRRRIAERIRREKESAFRKDCISRGILPNAQSTFAESMREQHAFIAKYYDEVHTANEDEIYEEDKKQQSEEMASELRAIIIRELPLGRDRYHNGYWLFKNDTQQRLFIEKCDTGEFVLCRTKEELLAVMAWLNPKGNREMDLLSKLEPVKEELLESLVESSKSSLVSWNAKGEIKVNLFPLPGGSVKQESLTIKDDDDERLSSHTIVQTMLLSLRNHLTQAGILSEDWDAATLWSSRVKEANAFEVERDLFLQLEDAVVGSTTGIETVRLSWQRKRREWRLALEGACTYAQLVFLLHLLLDECINVDAFMDQYARLDRKDWFKLRVKESRNFVPEVGNEVVYFGDGHAQALKEDAKTKKKRFAQKSDPPRPKATLVCAVQKISYHHGGGDPYALVMLAPKAELSGYSFIREPGSLLCPQPSPLQRLSRILLRIVTKLKLHPDAGPFLEPVSDRDFPEYKEIVPHPMNFAKVTSKVKTLEYQDAAQLFADVKLICSNCELFCEGRFPALPPLARNLVEMTDGLLKKSSKEIRACEKAINNSSASATPSPEKAPQQPGKSPEKDGESKEAESSSDNTVTSDLTKPITAILRLENRLPEYVVDIKRYEIAASRTWACGERFRMLFRDPQGFPGEYYGGIAAGALPFAANGLLPWEALRVTWDEDDGSDDSRINPWEAELVQTTKK